MAKLEGKILQTGEPYQREATPSGIVSILIYQNNWSQNQNTSHDVLQLNTLLKSLT